MDLPERMTGVVPHLFQGGVLKIVQIKTSQLQRVQAPGLLRQCGLLQKEGFKEMGS
jgi:hypothetical protein